MAEIQFTHEEQAFIDNIMRPFAGINPILYETFLENVLNQRLEGIKADNAKELVESIVCKLVMHRADIEIERMLVDPSYGNTPDTKIA